jgi:hypothetical protein
MLERVFLQENYETILETSKKRSYSIKPENLNLQQYKHLLLKKLSDTLEITGFNLAEINSQFLQKHRLVKTETQVVILDRDSRDNNKATAGIGSKFSFDQSNNRSIQNDQPKQRRLKLMNFNVMDLIRCKYNMIETSHRGYFIIPADPALGILYVNRDNPEFISGHVRVRGKAGGSYPYKYLGMIDAIFGREDNTIEVCSYSVKGIDKGKGCFTVDINPATNPNLVEDGQTLLSISDNRFNRWRCDPPYNVQTAKRMYGTDLPLTGKLLKAGARVSKVGSLMFLLLGHKNYQVCPQGVKRIGWIDLTVIPNNEVRSLHIFYKYAAARA